MSTPLRERPDAPLGTLIFRAGLLPAETIESALEEGVKTGKRLGEILTERGLLKEADLARLLAGQKGLEFVTLREQIVDQAAASLFSENQARLFRALPYTFEDDTPVVAIADPSDEVLMRNIREALGREDAKFVVSVRSELDEIIGQVYEGDLGAAPTPQPEAPAPERYQQPEAPVHEHEAFHEPEWHQSPEPAPPSPEPVAYEQPEAAAPEPEAYMPEPELAMPHADAAPESESPPLRAFSPVDPTTAAQNGAGRPEDVVMPAAVEPTPDPSPPLAPRPVPAPEPFAAVEPVADPTQPHFDQSADPLLVPAPEPTPESTPLAAPEPPRTTEPALAAEAPSPEAAPARDATESTPYSPPVISAAAPPASFRVSVRLTNGERVEAGDFGDLEAAKQQAKALMAQVAAADGGDWPFVNGRFLKPDTIISVDIL